jgi:hypothetical protein
MVSLRPLPLALCLAVGALTACGGSDSSAPPQVAGPPSTIVKTGDMQIADPGTAVAIAPSVTIQDAQGRPVPGIVVTFSIGDGGGSISNPLPITNAAGVATIGEWKLGPLPGASNTLVVTVGDLPPETFSATASGTNPCRLATGYTIGSTANGTFAASDCPADDGSFIDFYSTTVSASGMYVFTEAAGFNTYLLLDQASGLRVAENGDSTRGPTSTSINVLMPSGDYVLLANTFFPRTTGAYTLSSSQVSSSVENCSDVFIARGVTTDQTLAPTDCSNNGFLSDDVFIFIQAGQSITVSMNSTSFDAYLEIYSRQGLVASNDDKDATTTNAQITFSATSSDYYLISPTSKLSGAPGATGAYTLIAQ